MNPFHSCRVLFRPLVYSWLLLAALPVQAQYTFTLLADQPSFGIEPELRPHIAGSEVTFSGRLSTHIFKAGPNRMPVIIYASNDDIPGVKPTEPFYFISLVD